VLIKVTDTLEKESDLPMIKVIFPSWFLSMKLQAVGPRAIYDLGLISPGYLPFANLKNLEILNGRIK